MNPTVRNRVASATSNPTSQLRMLLITVFRSFGGAATPAAARAGGAANTTNSTASTAAVVAACRDDVERIGHLLIGCGRDPTGPGPSTRLGPLRTQGHLHPATCALATRTSGGQRLNAADPAREVPARAIPPRIRRRISDEARDCLSASSPV